MITNTCRLRKPPIYLLLFLIGISIILPGCFTSSLLKTAPHDRKPEKVTQILHSSIDSAGNMDVIYKAKRLASVKSSVYTLSVNIDSGLRYCGQPLPGALPDSAVSKTGIQAIHYFYSPEPGKNARQVIVAANHINQPGYTPGNDSNRLLLKSYTRKIFLPPEFNKTEKRRKQKYITMLFDDTATTGSRPHPANKTFFISVLPEKRAYWRYWLLPGSLTADMVTLPFQAVFFGLLWLLKDIPLS